MSTKMFRAVWILCKTHVLTLAELCQELRETATFTETQLSNLLKVYPEIFFLRRPACVELNKAKHALTCQLLALASGVIVAEANK